MLKRFDEFSENQRLNEGSYSMNLEENIISPDSSYWMKAINYFKTETQKDLTKFNWVFKDNDPKNGGIIPQNFIIALLSASPVTSKYKSVIEYIKDMILQEDLSYSAKYGDDFVQQGNNSLQNSKALYKIWINYFYEPIKRAVQTKNFDSITLDGMADFEERMWIFNADLDSDWKQFFAAIKMGLQTIVEVPAAQPAPAQAPKSSVAPRAKVATPSSSAQSNAPRRRIGQ